MKQHVNMLFIKISVYCYKSNGILHCYLTEYPTSNKPRLH